MFEAAAKSISAFSSTVLHTGCYSVRESRGCNPPTLVVLLIILLVFLVPSLRLGGTSTFLLYGSRGLSSRGLDLCVGRREDREDKLPTLRVG